MGAAPIFLLLDQGWVMKSLSLSAIPRLYPNGPDYYMVWSQLLIRNN